MWTAHFQRLSNTCPEKAAEHGDWNHSGTVHRLGTVCVDRRYGCCRLAVERWAHLMIAPGRVDSDLMAFPPLVCLIEYFTASSSAVQAQVISSKVDWLHSFIQCFQTG